ncbi:DUF805 domain-containing protein [Arthrobacter agilis]|uniref:hypothetical protein n=1 Tax=Arthrobacter agilis TaxID=37921 RepID=UPI000B361EFC|nr:hypothetical protein [Arthrobacter agilis]OUM43002.1 hypothetical protein B8W74_07060 [Arthrobacter agilis]PPB45947.1 hypothetical protein CI784_09255 [Arthrobacter agilis]TPV25488.1 DUF805 domain-containing protein [Arthrobacter agilis]VDR33232.1 Uncharacterised protein [Arthrobacter agilis]
MSTPQDTPGHGRDDSRPDGQGWNPPGPDGNQHPYGQRNDGGQYGSPQGPTSGYAYPSSAPEVGTRDKGPAPKEVMRAYYLILAAGILSLVASLVSAFSAPSSDMAMAGVGIGITLVFAVIVSAIYVVLAVFIRKGHNWARITATVFAALSVLGVLGTLLLLPLASQAAETSGQQLPPVSGLGTALDVVVMLLGVAGVVMTYLKPARPYFAAQKLGY